MDRRGRGYESNSLKTSPYLYDGIFPEFSEAVECGSFSQDEKRQFRHDRSQLKVFAPPKDWNNCRFDLRDGYKNMIKKDESVKDYLNDLLSWIVESKHTFFPQSASCETASRDGSRHLPSKAALFHSLNTDFICWRKLLTRVARMPYERSEDFLIAVIRFRGTYFMCEYDTEAKKKRVEEETPRQQEMCAWGWKFEQYVTADKGSQGPNTRVPVNNNACFSLVARACLGPHSLVFGAEVDCEDTNCKKGNKYVELKTSRIIETQRQRENFYRFKLIKWWAQSFLIGIPRVVCGFRDDDGVVHQLQDFPVREMPNLARSSSREPWKPAVCFKFLSAFLQFVKSSVTEDNERYVYLFRWQPGSDVTCERRGDDPEFHFLPDWFIKWEAWDTPCSS